MNMREVTWRPDTCACVIRYEVDADLPLDQRTFTAIPGGSVCADHDGLTAAERLAEITQETQGRSKIHERLRNFFASKLGVIDRDGNQVLRDGAYSFSFSGKGKNRVLTISLPLLTNAERNACQTWADNNVGVGRVIVTA